MLQGVILGSGASRPSADRNPSAIFVRVQGIRILLDCGQGTQKALLTHAPDFFSDIIVISHHHTDHDHGLKPYLETMSLLDRRQALCIYTPEPGKVSSALASSIIRYPVRIVRATPGVEFIHGRVAIRFSSSNHSIPCVGTLIESADRVRYDRERLLMLPESERGALFREESRLLQRETYRLPDCPRYSLYYSGDTVWDKSVVGRVHPQGLLIHQCTFIRKQDRSLARRRHHTHRQEVHIEGVRYILTHIGQRLPRGQLQKSYPLINGTWAYDGMTFDNKIW